jgi:NADH dehydrogenase/putative oxidoreductase
VVIVGGGFGGVAAARMLRTTACRITLIDRHNYHLFQPLLYQVATAGLSPTEIAMPIRSLFDDQPNIQIILNEVVGVDKIKKEVKWQCNQNILGKISYDYLILATGAKHSYFGNDAWAKYAPGLKKIEDAMAIRQRVLSAFEKAENTDDTIEQMALLTFIIIGGGPTGIELAGALAELAHQGMENEFRNIDPKRAKIILIEAGPRLLNSMHEGLSDYTMQALEKLGVEVRLNARVAEMSPEGLVVNSQFLAVKNIFWAAGVKASNAAIWLEVEADKMGRVIVNKDLSVPGTENIYAIGDTVLAHVWSGAPMPGVAPAAKQSGQYVAKKIRAAIEGKNFTQDFIYKNYGNLATIGRRVAVIDFGYFRVRGVLAWWFWGAIHLYFLNNMHNRLQVMLKWFWSYLTFKKSSRIIYETSNETMGKFNK